MNALRLLSRRHSMPVNHSISTAHCFIIRRKSRWRCIVQFDCVVSLAATTESIYYCVNLYKSTYVGFVGVDDMQSISARAMWWWLLLQHHRRTEVQKTWKSKISGIWHTHTVHHRCVSNIFTFIHRNNALRSITGESVSCLFSSSSRLFVLGSVSRA